MLTITFSTLLCPIALAGCRNRLERFYHGVDTFLFGRALRLVLREASVLADDMARYALLAIHRCMSALTLAAGAPQGSGPDVFDTMEKDVAPARHPVFLWLDVEQQMISDSDLTEE